MMTFAANISLLFTEHAFLDRFAAAADAGFTAVEFLFPYDHDPAAIANALSANQLDLALFNTPAGHWQNGERGFASLFDAQDQFRASIDLTLEYAEILCPDHIHIMAGCAKSDQADRVFAENVKWACDRAPTQSFLIEPINPHDMPGYFLNDLSVALLIMSSMKVANLGLQFDAYHIHRIHSDVVEQLSRALHHVRHIQIAGAPGRHEPIQGEIDFAALISVLNTVGYSGYVSGEYNPLGSTVEGLGWVDRLRAA